MYDIRIILLAVASSLAAPATAATIGVTYNFTGTPVGPEVQSGTTLTVDHFATGSVLSGDPSLNAIWNRVTYLSHDVIDLSTGILNGVLTMTFANADTLSANLIADLSQGFTGGPTPQTFTFTGGTGEFAGATGSFSGSGGPLGNGYSIFGTGTINAPAAVPEPASAALFLSGIAVMVVLLRRAAVKHSSSQT